MIDTTAFLFGIFTFFLLVIWIIQAVKNPEKSSSGFFGIRDDDEFYEAFKDKRPF